VRGREKRGQSELAFSLLSVTIHYQRKDFWQKAWQALHSDQDFDLVVSGWRAKLLQTAKPLFDADFLEPRHMNKKVKGLRYGFYFLISGQFWVISVHARDAGMSQSWEESNDSLVISFKKPPK